MRKIKILSLIGLFLLISVLFVQADSSVPKLAPEEILGTTDYYRWRYNDFMERHPQLVEPDSRHIPDYYLDYGEKYIVKFTENLFPKLSDEGKKWLIVARLNLQLAMRKECITNRKKYAALEEKPKKFREFAFGTHQDSYLDAGLADLPFSDLIKIGTTPDLKDLLSKDGIIQIFGISKGLSKDKIKKIFAFIRKIYRRICVVVSSGNPDEIEDILRFVETLSSSDKKIIRISTRSFSSLRKIIKTKLLEEKNDRYQDLLNRLDSLNSN